MMSESKRSGLPILCTAAFERAQTAIAEAINQSGVVALQGGTGVGKDFATDCAFEVADTSVARISARFAPSGTNIAACLQGANAGFARSTYYPTLQRVGSWLRDVPVVIVIDECECLKESGAATVCYLHDREELQASFVLIYGCQLDEHRRFQSLARRTRTVVDFLPLAPEELTRWLPAANPIYDGIASALVEAIDWAFCEGRLRHWSLFTIEAEQVCNRSGTTLGALEAKEALGNLVGPDGLEWPL